MNSFSFQIGLLFAILIVVAETRLELTKFYSDPDQMLLQKPINFEDLRYYRLKSLRDEKLKRRRAAPTPIRITPFYYSMNPVDLMDNSVGSARTRSSSPYYSSFYGRK
uniref:Uncharacterized protein n=1 Tax=Panagrolaimus sp. PS1159 TaxID=55785 RepID=A0AC35FVI9_9BILA